MEPRDFGWPVLVALFLASLLIVLAWLFQYALGVLRPWRARRSAARLGHAGGVRGFLQRLRSDRDGTASEAGVKALLTSVLCFKSFREKLQRSWVQALNLQACRHGSAMQITFDGDLQLAAAAAALKSATLAERSSHRMVLDCKCCVDAVTFPVTVTQQSPAAVSMDTYQITLAPMVAKVVVYLREVEDEGLLLSWTLCKQPAFALTASPCTLQRKEAEGSADLDVIRGLIEDALFSSQPAVVLHLRSSAPRPPPPVDHPSAGLNSLPRRNPARRLLLRQLRATFGKAQWWRAGELCCVLSLNQPPTERTTGFLPAPGNAGASLEWSDEITMELSSESKELRVRLLERSGPREQFLPGQAGVALDARGEIPVAVTLTLSPEATVTMELLLLESEELRGASPLRSSLTPAKKVDVDRTVMPDGTIVTTVTTVQSRLKLERGPADSPSKVEVSDKTAGVPQDGRGSSPDPSKTAIRQLTESACKAARKTPTKRSTLIISGVSKVPLSEDDCALSSGYAAAMDAAVHGNHFGPGQHQDPDETTPSDVSERPSVDDVESDTGSTGALETRSLKDHKVGFLQSGTKLLFRRRHREKESCLSQSHEDISNAGANFSAAAAAAATASGRKKSGSFSRRLIKRFSFRSSGKSKGKGTSTNGGTGSFNN